MGDRFECFFFFLQTKYIYFQFCLDLGEGQEYLKLDWEDKALGMEAHVVLSCVFKDKKVMENGQNLVMNTMGMFGLDF